MDTVTTLPTTLRRPPARRHALLAPLLTLARRRFQLAARTPRELVVPLLTPIMFALVIAPALKTALHTSADYESYVALGTIGLLIPLNTMFLGIGSIVDRESGARRELLAAPVPRSLLVLGNFPVALATTLLQIAVLLARLAVGTSTWTASAYMLILGLGLGMVMQVLVLAVQNAVDYRNMGVATSGSLLFRQIGGSVGIAIFGAIFANRLHGNLASQLPAGVQGPKNVSPQVVRNLPPALHEAYVRAVAEALHPVFVVASVIAIFAFLLTWLLREVPLRDSARPASGEDLAGTASAEPAAVTASQRG